MKLVVLLVSLIPFIIGCKSSDYSPHVINLADPLKEKLTLRFVVIGDSGKAGDNLSKVAAAIKFQCDLKPCDFALLLGDNVYVTGVTSAKDSLFAETFQKPLSDPLGIPFYVVVGNHDYGGAGIPLSYLSFGSSSKIEAQLDYGKLNKWWRFPARYYAIKSKLAHFLALDTSALVLDGEKEQQYFFKSHIKEIAKVSPQPWIFAMGHHTIRSNGKHGNVGHYPAIEHNDGNRLASFFDESLCGFADAVFTGHDHNLQWHGPLCQSTYVFVSGSAAKVTPLRAASDQQNKDGWDLEKSGFLIIDLTEKALDARFYDLNGHEVEQKTISR